MILKKDNLDFHLITGQNFQRSKLTPLVFLHGFTGSGSDWQFCMSEFEDKFQPVAIDLIGHGLSNSPEDPELYSAKSLVNQLHFIFTALGFKNIILAGYSMGGRAAISYTVNHPEMVKALILESTTPGISEADQRLERRRNDKLLASRIKSIGVVDFITEWMNSPIFSTQKNLNKTVFNEIKSRKIKNNSTGLSNSLRGFGTGSMPDYWGSLKRLNQDTLLLTGSLDKKFTEISRKMETLLPNSTHEIISDAGHNLHLEKPDDFIILTKRFLYNLEELKSK
jgi:2-succinyl-6-hydroxy-2,4-cyclohexadiene-1-carboxylate synthase